MSAQRRDYNARLRRIAGSSVEGNGRAPARDGEAALPGRKVGREEAAARARLAHMGADAPDTASPYAPPSAPLWDREQLASARASADEMMEYDPDGAVMLYAEIDRQEAEAARRAAQAAGEVEEDDTVTPLPIGRTQGRTPYDPMRLFARLAHFYPGFTHTAMRQMDKRAFFGYVREMWVMQEEERNETERAMREGRRRARNARANGVTDDPYASYDAVEDEEETSDAALAARLERLSQTFITPQPAPPSLRLVPRTLE